MKEFLYGGRGFLYPDCDIGEMTIWLCKIKFIDIKVLIKWYYPNKLYSLVYSCILIAMA
jgi:hypothetical protein